MKRVLCLYAHPNPESSRANRQIVEALRSFEFVTVHPLYEIYPEFYIDVKREQALLLEHDVLMLQHPFYWYSMPPLLKLWLDAVLEYGFAYGPKGTALQGKEVFLSITTGGPFESYSPQGYNNFTIEDFFPPYIQTASLCGMKWREPAVLHHALKISDQQLKDHSQRLSELVQRIAQES